MAPGSSHEGIACSCKLLPTVMRTSEDRRTFNSFNQQLIAHLRANGGQATSGPFAGRPLVILSTVGARSKQPHEIPLVYTRDGDRYVVIASKGGAPTNPSWYHNLLAEPVVTLEVLGERFQARARAAEGEERDRLYRKQAEKMPAFADYQRKTRRKIPVVVLERIPG
jgi:deazaflavin-dependent oxidoreductase (nitroreductase family)